MRRQKQPDRQFVVGTDKPDKTVAELLKTYGTPLLSLLRSLPYVEVRAGGRQGPAAALKPEFLQMVESREGEGVGAGKGAGEGAGVGGGEGAGKVGSHGEGEGRGESAGGRDGSASGASATGGASAGGVGEAGGAHRVPDDDDATRPREAERRPPSERGSQHTEAGGPWGLPQAAARAKGREVT